MQAAVRAFDGHLNASFIVRGEETTLRVTPLPTASQATAQLTPAVTVNGVYQPGPGVTSPVPTYRPEPQYSEQARAAKWQGAVLVSVVIDATGTPTNIKVVRPLGLGLDEQAIEAVHQWKFQPGTKEGVPVPVQAQIEVAFRLSQPQ